MKEKILKKNSEHIYFCTKIYLKNSLKEHFLKVRQIEFFPIAKSFRQIFEKNYSPFDSK